MKAVKFGMKQKGNEKMNKACHYTNFIVILQIITIIIVYVYTTSHYSNCVHCSTADQYFTHIKNRWLKSDG